MATYTVRLEMTTLIYTPERSTGCYHIYFHLFAYIMLSFVGNFLLYFFVIIPPSLDYSKTLNAGSYSPSDLLCDFDFSRKAISLEHFFYTFLPEEKPSTPSRRNTCLDTWSPTYSMVRSKLQHLILYSQKRPLIALKTFFTLSLDHSF